MADPAKTPSPNGPQVNPVAGKEQTRQTPEAPKLLDSGRRAIASLPNYAYWVLLLPLSIAWWYIAGHGNSWQSILLAAVSSAAFMVGALVGFLFTSYGDELATMGKIRDWIIAGITGATLVELAQQGGSFKQLLLTFKTPGTDDFGLVISMAIVYFACGFFFMFLQRELLLNLILAASRRERGRLDGTVQAELAIQKLLNSLPPSLLTGTEDLGKELDPKQAAELRSLLDSNDVRRFLIQAEDAIKAGMQMDWDTVVKAAYVYYYRVYFSSATEQPALVDRTLEWIKRALLFNPMHVDLTMKYADMLGFDDQHEAAVAVLEGMAIREDAPAYVNNRLGYALLWIPERLPDAIKRSAKFLEQFPDSADAPFNLACAHAQFYCQELKAGSAAKAKDSENGRLALKYLEDALRKDRGYMNNIRAKEEDFDCLESDPDYKDLINSISTTKGG